MHIIWITTQFPNGRENRNGIFIYRTVKELGKFYNITVLVLYPVIPPLIPMFKNFRDWKKIYKKWRTAFPSNPEFSEGLENFEVQYIKYVRPPRMNYIDFEGWFAYLALKKYFKKIASTNNNIIHAAWIFPSGHAAKILSKKFKLPFIVTLMGSDVNFIRQNTARYKSAEKIIRAADKTTSVSKVLIEELIKKKILKDDCKTALTHTIYDFLKFKINNKETARNELGIEAGKRMIFFAGSLRKLKNADLLIKSSALLLEEKFNINLFIAGAGYEEDNLRRLVEKENLNERVKFLGNLNEDSIIKNYNAADVFCLPSSNEGLPNVIVESLLCGTPVVASKVGEIPYIIKDDANGYLVDPNSLEGLINGLKKALNKKWDRHFIRESISFLSTANILAEYKNVYNEVLKGK